MRRSSVQFRLEASFFFDNWFRHLKDKETKRERERMRPAVVLVCTLLALACVVAADCFSYSAEKVCLFGAVFFVCCVCVCVDWLCWGGGGS